MPLTLWRPFGKVDPWQPFGEIDTLRKEMNNLLEQFTSNLPDNGDGLTFIPSAEMDETEKEIHLKLEVPGMQVDDLDIEVMDDSVSIKGERKSETKTKENGKFRSEFHYGKFERVIPIPSNIAKDQVVADYKDGVLSLTIPKTEEAVKESVKVSVS